MQPWKMFIRSASVVTVLTVGGFAAGQAVVPFANTSRSTSPAVEEEAPDTEAPTVDPAAEVDETDSTTTTPETEAPKPDAPAVDPVEDPAPTTPPADEAPEESTTTPTPTTSAPIDVTAAPPAAPVADPAPAEAKKAKKEKKAKKDKKAKGDHNCDGNPDNGWLKHTPPNKTYPTCPPAGSAPAAPAPAPAPAASAQDSDTPKGDHNGDGHCDNGQHKKAQTKCVPAVRGDRPETAPGQENRPAGAPGQLKKSL